MWTKKHVIGKRLVLPCKFLLISILCLLVISIPFFWVIFYKKNFPSIFYLYRYLAVYLFISLISTHPQNLLAIPPPVCLWSTVFLSLCLPHLYFLFRSFLRSRGVVGECRTGRQVDPGKVWSMLNWQPANTPILFFHHFIFFPFISTQGLRTNLNAFNKKSLKIRCKLTPCA